ncbi:MAG: hypothetical protein AB1646_09860 [Thermodesulfobacteriota bacterium]
MAGIKALSVCLTVLLSLAVCGAGFCQDTGGASGPAGGATTTAPATPQAGEPSGFSLSSGIGSANVTGNSATSPAVELAKLGLQNGTSYSGRAMYRAPYGATVTLDYFGQRMTGSSTFDQTVQVFQGIQPTTQTTQVTTLLPVEIPN